MAKGRASLMKVLVFSLCVDATRLVKSSCPKHAHCLSTKGKLRLAASRSVDSILPKPIWHTGCRCSAHLKAVTQGRAIERAPRAESQSDHSF